MKRNLLALAIGAAVLLPLTAQAAPTVYGRLNLSVDYTDVDMGPGVDGVDWTVNSNASRVGVKGNEKLSDDFTAVYKAEWQINGDVAGGGDLRGRERYIGLKHSSFGTIRLGAIDSPLKTSEDMVDAFNDLSNLDMENYVTGQVRLDNSVNYVSPKILDVFGANITFQPGERRDATATFDGGENSLVDGISAAFSYEDDNLYLSAAMDKDIATATPSIYDDLLWNTYGINMPETNRDAIRLVGRYKMDKITFAGLIQQSEWNSNVAGNIADEDAFVLSAAYEMDKVTLKGEVLKSKVDFGAGSEASVTLIGLGVDYNFTANTKVFGNLAQVTLSDDIAPPSVDTDMMQLGGGIEVRF